MNDSVKNKDLFYLVHPDPLGSYTHITNANKQVIRNLHFDPWGNVKSDTNWLTFDSTTLSGNLAGTFRFSRGFTGHEHYADLKIINMKAPSKREQKQACLIFVEREVLRDEVSTYGRLYDPVIARFFSPDNFVQAPGFTQSYNRYSYCLNNPLQWVDPSGENMLDPWYRDAIGIVRWTDSEFKMPKGGFFLGSEGVFTSDGEMRYYYADGRISNNKIAQVSIDWDKPAGFTFSLSSFPMRDAGFYRIGDPSEQTGSFSNSFQYVAPISPGYINGLNGFSLSNGVKNNLFDAVVRCNFSDSQRWYQFRKLGKESNIRIEKTLGRVGSKYLKMSKMLGGAASATSTVIEIANYGIYTTTNGFDWMVTTKFGMDLIMTGIGFLGPVGLIVSTSYFILDVTTDGFGGFGKMY